MISSILFSFLLSSFFILRFFFCSSFFFLRFFFFLSVDSVGNLAQKFLTPILILSEEDVLFVHSVKQWHSIEVGYNETHVRFGLRKFPLTLAEGQTADQVNQVYIQVEIPPDHDVVEKFQSDTFKGVKLRLKQVKGKEKNDFSMS